MTSSADCVLYVEDDNSDALFFSSCWSDAEVSVPLRIEESVAGAIELLEKQDRTASRVLLILLDINLPVADGFQLLEWLRSRPAMPTVPVVMFSSSESPADMTKAYSLGAQGYVVKPDSIVELLRIVKSLRDFWLLVNRVP